MVMLLHSFKLGLLVLFVCVINNILGVDGNCGMYTATDGSKYNLSSLTKPKSVGYSIVLGAYTYYFNLCDTYASSLTELHCYAAAPAYQLSATSLCYMLAAMPAVISDGINGPATGVTIKYTNEEDRCLYGQLPRIVNVNVKCDLTNERVLSVSEPATCVYDFAMTSPAACPLKEHVSPEKKIMRGLSPGSIFLIVLLVAIVVYLVGGVVYRYKFQEIEVGVDLIPNLPFWTSIPGLVKDGCVFTYEKIKERIDNR